MSQAPATEGFGAPEEFGAHVFRVEIPAHRTGDVEIIEDYGYRGGDDGVPHEEARAVVARQTWTKIADEARRSFNERLKAKKIRVGRWRTGTTKVDRLLGKELCVLAWAAEQAKSPEELPVICARWAALRPEERWWLFSMTVAEAGLPEDTGRGWRKALYFALSDAGTRSTKPRPKRLSAAEQSTLPLFRGVE